jgi:hypothetical protein
MALLPYPRIVTIEYHTSVLIFDVGCDHIENYIMYVGLLPT